MVLTKKKKEIIVHEEEQFNLFMTDCTGPHKEKNTISSITHYFMPDLSKVVTPGPR